jgi:hypothetical protein
MFPSLWNALQALLLALGIIWCKEMFPKWREHIHEFHIGNWSDRTVLMLLWGLTILILFFSIHFIYGIGRPILRAIHDLM